MAEARIFYCLELQDEFQDFYLLSLVNVVDQLLRKSMPTAFVTHCMLVDL